MPSLQKAYLATIQRFRDYYEAADDYQLALRPISSIDTPLVEHITVEEWENGIEEYQNKFMVASLSNEIIRQPYKYMELGQMTWDVYEEALMVSETTSALASRYSDARSKLDIDSETVPGEGLRYKRTSLSEPTWQEEVIEAAEFDGLIEKAKQNQAFMDAFNTTYGLDEDLDAEVTMVRFKKAEVRIIRPWLDTTFLNNRNWRFKQHQTVAGDKEFLSDDEPGKEFEGAMPAYPEKFVFIKDVEMVFQLPGSEEDDDTSELMENGHIINFGPILLNQMVKVPSQNIYKAKGLSTNMTFNRLIRTDFYNNVQTTPKADTPTTTTRPTTGSTGTGSLNMTIRPGVTNFNTFKPQATTQFNVRPSAKPLQVNVQLANPSTSTSFYQALLTRPEAVKLNTAALQYVNWKKVVTDDKAVLKGQVKGKQNQPLPDAEVLIRSTLSNGQTSVQKVNTNSAGKYEVKVSKGVSFDITVSEAGYIPKTETGKADKNTKVVNVRLSPKPTQIEKKSDIQLLAVVYRKLGKVPNPIPNFVPISDDF